jgi:hypothetical protein
MSPEDQRIHDTNVGAYRHKLRVLDEILKEANTMNDTFHPDEVPSHLKDAARDCQDVRRQVEKRLLGGLPNDERIPGYPTIPKPVMDGQTYAFPVYNRLSGMHIANLHYVAAGGIFHLIGREDLTGGNQSW